MKKYVAKKIQGKLYLCTRDLKISKAFRKVGEISKEALWVKSGDEFSEKEVRKYADVDGEIIPWIEGAEQGGYKMIVFLKGPCGHFH